MTRIYIYIFRRYEKREKTVRYTIYETRWVFKRVTVYSLKIFFKSLFPPPIFLEFQSTSFLWYSNKREREREIRREKKKKRGSFIYHSIFPFLIFKLWRNYRRNFTRQIFLKKKKKNSRNIFIAINFEWIPLISTQTTVTLQLQRVNNRFFSQSSDYLQSLSRLAPINPWIKPTESSP